MAKLVVHLDIDAFFASVEQLLIPALRGRPVVVGSGVIASCSYEARRYGLRAGMPLHRARRLCPSVVVLEGDCAIYRCFAEHVWDVCRRYTAGLETYLDEAYGDATGMERLYGPPPALGRRLQRDVHAEVGLPVSVGLAGNRMLAKIASAAGKPGGVVWIAPDRVDAFLAPLPVARLPGIGPKTARQLHDLNVHTVADLRRLPRKLLRGMFGQRGEEIHDRARGVDAARVRPPGMPRTISRETTFHEPHTDAAYIRGMVQYLLERALRTARQAGLQAAGVELTLRYNDWQQLAARRTLPEPTDRDEDVLAVLWTLLSQLHRRRVALRHVGVVLGPFAAAAERPRLFEPAAVQRDRRLHDALDGIRNRWGHAAVVSGESIGLLGALEQNDYGFVLRTPSLTK